MANQMVECGNCGQSQFFMSVEDIIVCVCFFFGKDVKVVVLVGWHREMFLFILFEGKTIKKEQKKTNK